MARGSAGETALQKNLRILQAFDAKTPYLTLTEITERAGLPKSTTHRLLAELGREGLVERWTDRTYRLGARLYELASRAPGAFGLREVARPFLIQVQSVVRQHTQLAVLAGTDVLYIERVSARDSAINHTIIGGRIPAYASSFGVAMLAHASDETVQAVASSGFRAFTSATIGSESELRAVLARVQADGCAVLPGHVHPDSTGVAVPVYGPHGAVYAAIGVVVPNDGASPKPIIEILKRASANVTRALVRAMAGER